MATHESTINIAPGNSTATTPILWSSFASGANNITFDVNNVKADRMIILVACHSTLDNRFWIGTSDSRSSHTSKSYPYSAGTLGPMLIKSTLVTDGQVQSKFRSTIVADSEVWAIQCIGPFETARFKDSDGYINFCRGITTALAASHSSDTQWAAAILI